LTATAFELFYSWVFSGAIELADVREPSFGLTMLFYFAEKYNFPILVDASLAHLIAHHRTNNMVPNFADIPVIYERTLPGSKLRLYTARIIAFILLTVPSGAISGTWTDELLQQALAKDKNMLLDVLQTLRMKGCTELEDPREAPACDYHIHREDERCPYSQDP
jgi:hypothetical protein